MRASPGWYGGTLRPNRWQVYPWRTMRYTADRHPHAHVAGNRWVVVGMGAVDYPQGELRPR